MKKVFLHSLVLSLLSSSCIMNAAEAPTPAVKSCLLGNTNIVFATGVKIFEPNSSWVLDEHMGNLTLATPAEASLAPAGGLNGFVHKEAGPELATACAEKIASNGENNFEIGAAALTDSFKLGTKGIQHIAHIAASRCEYYPDNKAEQNSRLEDCYRNMCNVAHAAQSPAILSVLFGTGVGGYTIERSAGLLAQAITSLQETGTVKSVYIVCSKPEDMTAAVAAVKAFQLSSGK